MTRDVLITISGIQLAEGDSNEVEMITARRLFSEKRQPLYFVMTRSWKARTTL